MNLSQTYNRISTRLFFQHRSEMNLSFSQNKISMRFSFKYCNEIRLNQNSQQDPNIFVLPESSLISIDFSSIHHCGLGDRHFLQSEDGSASTSIVYSLCDTVRAALGLVAAWSRGDRGGSCRRGQCLLVRLGGTRDGRKFRRNRRLGDRKSIGKYSREGVMEQSYTTRSLPPPGT